MTRTLQRGKYGPDGPSSFPGSDFKGIEDCLFLSVYAPPDAANLPVFVWIHGGGYGQGQGSEDFGAIVQADNNTFISVVIQYRVS